MCATSLEFYRIGPFELDVTGEVIRKFGLPIKLERKPWQVLVALVRRPGEVVTRAELQRELWGDQVFVDFEHGLNVAVQKLRAMLCDSVDAPTFIETITGEGYRLIAQVEKVLPSVEISLPSIAGSEVILQNVPSPSVDSNNTGGRLGARFYLWGASALLLVGMALAIVSLVKPKAMLSGPNPTVLVGAFVNETDEPLLDGTLQFAIERELTNSRFVRVVSPERVHDILKLMRRPTDTPLDRSLALDICRRNLGVRGLIVGNVRKIGNQYLLMAVVIDPNSGTMEHAEEALAENQGDIIPAVHRLAVQVRQAVGEAIPAVPSNGVALEQVTTPSLRAVQLYSEADELMMQEGPKGERLVDLLQEALAQDPDFASAHIMLGHVLYNMGRISEASPHFERAMALADGTSEHERLFIIGSYHQWKSVTPEDSSDQKAMAAYEELLRHYADDFWANNNLRFLYARDGRRHEALSLRLRATELRPENAENDFAGTWSALNSDGQHAAADRLLAFCTRRIDLPRCTELLIVRDFQPVWQQLRNGQPEQALQLTRELIDRYKNATPETVEFLEWSVEDAYLDSGKYRDAEQLGNTRRYTDLHFSNRIFIPVYRGDRHAELEALSALTRSPHESGPLYVMLLADLGRPREAAIELYEQRKSLSVDYRRLARGYVELANGDLTRSISDLRAGYDLYKGLHTDAVARVADHLATALERSGRTEEALAILTDTQSELSRQGDVSFVHHYNLLVRVHLARLYRQTGRNGEADEVEDAVRGQLRIADPDCTLKQLLNNLPHPTRIASSRQGG